MRTFYQNLVTMMQVLVNWALSPQKVTTTNQVGVFKQGILDVQTKLQKIANLNQLLSITGVAGNKKLLRGLLTQMLLIICKPVRAYAIATSNIILKNEVSTSKSALNNMSAPDLVAFANGIIALLTPDLIADLQDAGYAVSDTDASSLSAATTSFNKSINAPKEAIGDREAINENITKLVQEANTIVRNVLDENIISFTQIDQDYVQEYAIKRKVTHTGIRHNRANVTVVNELNEPFIDVTVTVDELQKDGKTYKAKSAITDINGNAIPSGFESGIRTITISGPTVETKTFGPFQFVNGKTITKTFTCAPAFNLPAPAPESNTEESKTEETKSEESSSK